MKKNLPRVAIVNDDGEELMGKFWDAKDILILGAQTGSRKLVDLAVKEGAESWDVGLRAAASGGHRELIDFFYRKGSR